MYQRIGFRTYQTLAAQGSPLQSPGFTVAFYQKYIDKFRYVRVTNTNPYLGQPPLVVFITQDFWNFARRNSGFNSAWDVMNAGPGIDFAVPSGGIASWDMGEIVSTKIVISDWGLGISIPYPQITGILEVSDRPFGSHADRGYQQPIPQTIGFGPITLNNGVAAQIVNPVPVGFDLLLFGAEIEYDAAVANENISLLDNGITTTFINWATDQKGPHYQDYGGTPLFSSVQHPLDGVTTGLSLYLVGLTPVTVYGSLILATQFV
jgi:hypothetical protein